MAETALDLGLSTTHFDYREHDPGGVLLDKEWGDLKGLSLGAEVSGETAFLGFKADAQNDWVDYRGYLPQFTVDSRTRTIITRYHLQGGLNHTVNERFTIAATAGIGYRRWYRNIESTAKASGLREVYRWPYASLGARGDIRLTQSQQLILECQWYEVRKADLRVDYHSNRYDEVNLDLPHGNGYSFSASWRQAFTDRLSLQLATEYQLWRFARSRSEPLFSNGETTGYAATEPASKTRELTLSLGLRFMLE